MQSNLVYAFKHPYIILIEPFEVIKLKRTLFRDCKLNRMGTLHNIIILKAI